MLRFKEHLIEKEITEFGFTFEDFVTLDEMKLTDIPVKVEGPKVHDASEHPNTPPTGVPTAAEKGGNHWKKLREGASKYFNASPEEQHAMRKEATHVLGHNNLLGDEASNPKLAKSGEKIPDWDLMGNPRSDQFPVDVGAVQSSVVPEVGSFVLLALVSLAGLTPAFVKRLRCWQ